MTPFKTLDEALCRANNSEYGLAAGIFSSNPNTLEKACRELKAGTVYLNTYN